MIENSVQWALPDQRSLENPSTPLSDPGEWLTDILGGGKSSSGVKVNDETILTYSPIVRGINLIANAVAKLPTFVLKRTPEGGKTRATDHFAYRLVRWRPNQEQVAFVFKQVMQAQALIRGNSFAFIQRLGNGNADEMIPLPARKVWPIRVDGVKFYLYDTGTQIRKLEAISILHIRGLGLDSLLGLDMVNKASDSVGLGLAMQRYSGKFFANNARPSLAIEMEGTPDEPTIKRLRQEFGSMHAGIDNAHRVAMLTGGMKLNPFSAGANESQLIESRQFSLVDVANWLNLPVHKVGGEGRTAFASLEQENRSFIEDSVAPWLTTWEEELREKLLTEDEKESDSHVIKFHRVALLEADAKTVSEVLISQVNNGLLNADEARAILDMEPLPDEEGKRFRKPENIGFIDEADEDEEPEDDDEEQDETEEDERTKRIQQLTSKALSDTAGRMARRLVIAARKAAKNHRKFDLWLEHIEVQHRDVIVEAMTSAVEAMYEAYGGADDDACVLRSQAITIAVDALFDDVTKRLDDCLAISPPEEFVDAVETALAGFGVAAMTNAVKRVRDHAEESKSYTTGSSTTTT